MKSVNCSKPNLMIPRF